MKSRCFAGSLIGFLVTVSGLAQTNTFPPAGNVGIGTTNPGYKVDVSGGDTRNIYLDVSGNPAVGTTFGTGGRIELYNGATGAMTFATSAASYPFVFVTGNVGIGTPNPGYKLDVSGGGTRNIYLDVSGSPKIGTTFGTGGSIELYNGATGAMTFATSAASYPFVFSTGNVGIGTTTPTFALDIRKDQNSATYAVVRNSEAVPLAEAGFYARNNTGSGVALAVRSTAAGTIGEMLRPNYATLSVDSAIEGLSIGTTGSNAPVIFGTALSERMRITPSGNVGIGTTAPTHKLSVNGTIRSKEVIVETTGWSDYVFADDYALKPLAEVEAHIKEHKHLPGIPSAKEVAEQGVSLGEMQAKLLAKIEELTLHMIAQEKKTSERLLEQEQRIRKLEQENRQLRGGF